MSNRRKKLNLKKAVQGLLDLIAKRHNKARADTILAEACSGPNGRANISVYAVRQWLERGIPEKHWGTVAKLAGLPENEIERIHQ